MMSKKLLSQITQALLFLFTSVLLIGANNKNIEVITVCEASKGHSYYFENESLNIEGGWHEDGFKGEVVFLFENGKPDIKTGPGQSKMGSGASVSYIRNPNDLHMYTVYVVFPLGDIEFYTFSLDQFGNGEVVWGSVRGVGILPKSSLYRAKCKKPGN